MQYGRVTAKELVEAVHEMLSAAGINMELENQSLLQRTLTLQEELKESQAAFLLEQVWLQSKSSVLKRKKHIIFYDNDDDDISKTCTVSDFLAGESRSFTERSRVGEITMGL